MVIFSICSNWIMGTLASLWTVGGVLRILAEIQIVFFSWRMCDFADRKFFAPLARRTLLIHHGLRPISG